MRVVVVGSGVAGLTVARLAAARHDVTVVTRGEAAESATLQAQGGIAAALGPGDRPAAHAADTISAAVGLADPRAVEVLCTEGPARVRELLALGIPFDRDAAGALALGREAAHGARRIVHAGGDATGRALELGLLDAVAAAPIDWREHSALRELVVADGPRGRRVTGLEVEGPDGVRQRIDADAVVLATGGAGRLYRHTTDPAVVTGDGIAAALRAGAVVADLEFVQFHPTALAVPGTPLISEAVRGEGAVLRDGTGRRFLLDAHPDAELAPRDVVARGVAAAMARQGGRPVLLDATALAAGPDGPDALRRRFPTLDAAIAAAGYDWAREPIPVTPAAHYLMGGVATDLEGRSSLPGLIVVGEAARTGVHGANRLASNSLLEGLVFGARAAVALGVPGPGPALVAATPVEVEPVPAEPFGRDALRELMWERAGLVRDGTGLRAAAGILAGWSAEASGDPDARDPEDAGMLDLARAIVGAALARTESRGAHHRTDHPATDPGQARSRAFVAPARIPELVP